MDTKKLRQKILDLAISGKLVPQDPNDEPASVLLERIRAEKERLIKEGKIKRSKKSASSDTSHYEDVPFKAPIGWCWCRLDDIAFVTKLAGFEYTNFIADNLSKIDGVPLFKGKNVQDGKIIYNFESFIPQEISNSLPRSQVNRKCLLTPYVGTIGNIGIHDKPGVYHLGSNVGKIELFNEQCTYVYEEFIRYYLMSSYGYKELTKHKKATAQDSISIDAIRDVYIALPPTNEQLRIIEQINYLISFLNEIEENKEHVTELVKLSKSRILELAIHGKLVQQDPNDEPAIEHLKKINPKFTPCDNTHDTNQLPNSWCWTTLGCIFQHNTGKALNKSDVKEGSLKNYLTTSNVYWNSFDFSDVKQMYFKDSELEKCTVSKGDLLVCEGGDIGRAAIWNLNYDICIQNHIHRLRAKGKVSPVLYMYVLMFYKWTNIIQGKGIGLQGLSSGLLDKLVVPLPPYNEQIRIVGKIEELFAVLDELMESLGG